jgi:hypothetical protein
LKFRVLDANTEYSSFEEVKEISIQDIGAAIDVVKIFFPTFYVQARNVKVYGLFRQT